METVSLVALGGDLGGDHVRGVLDGGDLLGTCRKGG